MHNHPEPNDDRLRTLLRGARPAPPLPPRFSEAVWRRIERAEDRPALGLWLRTWLEGRLEHLLRPRVALAGLALALAAGGVTGVLSGMEVAKQRAQDRYVAAVAPYPIR